VALSGCVATLVASHRVCCLKVALRSQLTFRVHGHNILQSYMPENIIF
jgi:hypothetical protein